jgi:hypothetical protein
MSNQHQSIHLGFNHDIARPPTTLGFLPQSSNPYNDLIKSASLYLRADQPDGKPFTKLEPRTLPNGVSNGEYLQRVRDDRPLVPSDFDLLFSGTHVQVIGTKVIGTILDNFTSGINKFATEDLPYIFGTWPGIDLAENIGKIAFPNSNDRIRIVFPLGTFSTIAEGQAWVSANLINIRYELATPIDRLNVPFKNPWTDLKGVVGKNLFDAMAVIDGFIVSQTNGNLEVSALYCTSSFIPVMQNTQYARTVITSTKRVAFYDSNRFFISGGIFDVFTTPSNCAFVRTSCLITEKNTFQLELGSTATAYEPYGKANCLLQAFTGTTADGYTVQTIPHPNGRENAVFNQGVVNGDFANGTTGWGGVSATDIAVIDKTLSFKATAQFGHIRQIFDSTLLSNKKFFIKAQVLAFDNTVRLRLDSASNDLVHTGSGQYENLYSVFSIGTPTTNQIRIQDNKLSNWNLVQVKDVVLIPMTGTPYENFTADQMNALVNSTTYWEGDKTLMWNNLTFLNLDGLNSFGQFANMDVLNPVGTDDFCQMVVFRPDDTGVARYFGISRNNNGGGVDAQFGLVHGNLGSTGIAFGGAITNISTEDTTFQYVLFGRISGRLFAIKNSTVSFDIGNNTSIISKPNTQLCCRSNSADGLTKSTFAKGLQGDIAFWKGAQGTLDKDKIVSLVRKAMKQKYNLGV